MQTLRRLGISLVHCGFVAAACESRVHMSQVATNAITATAGATAVLALTRLAFRIGLLVFAAWLYRQSHDLNAIDKAAAFARAFSAHGPRSPRASTSDQTVAVPPERKE